MHIGMNDEFIFIIIIIINVINGMNATKNEGSKII
jgi:hypothetical protein